MLAYGESIEILPNAAASLYHAVVAGRVLGLSEVAFQEQERPFLGISPKL